MTLYATDPRGACSGASGAWRSRLSVPCAGVALALAACTPTPPSIRYQEWTASPITRGLAPLDDGQIGEIVDVLDTQQIRTAHLGVERASDPQVHTFAENLLSDEGKAREQLLDRLAQERVALQPSLLLQLMEARGSDARGWLSNETGAMFDRDFLGYEIRELTLQLDWLDHVLVPGAHESGLRAELQRRRTTAAARRGDAEGLNGRLSRAATPPAP